MRKITLLLVLSACGSSNKLAEGDVCVASSQCGPGLVCDFGQDPHVCVQEGQVPIDANPNAPDANPNAPDANPNAPDANPTQPDAAPPDAQTGTTLVVKNYLSWCSVSVNGGTESALPQQTVVVQPGTIPLSAKALTGFQLGTTPWHDTDGDTGSGDPGTRTGTGQDEVASTTETVGATDDCVWVCCETAATPGDCPATDQCP